MPLRYLAETMHRAGKSPHHSGTIYVLGPTDFLAVPDRRYKYKGKKGKRQVSKTIIIYFPRRINHRMRAQSFPFFLVFRLDMDKNCRLNHILSKTMFFKHFPGKKPPVEEGEYFVGLVLRRNRRNRQGTYRPRCGFFIPGGLILYRSEISS